MARPQSALVHYGHLGAVVFVSRHSGMGAEIRGASADAVFLYPRLRLAGQSDLVRDALYDAHLPLSLRRLSHGEAQRLGQFCHRLFGGVLLSDAQSPGDVLLCGADPLLSAQEIPVDDAVFAELYRPGAPRALYRALEHTQLLPL